MDKEKSIDQYYIYEDMDENVLNALLSRKFSMCGADHESVEHFNEDFAAISISDREVVQKHENKSLKYSSGDHVLKFLISHPYETDKVYNAIKKCDDETHMFAIHHSLTDALPIISSDKEYEDELSHILALGGYEDSDDPDAYRGHNSSGTSQNGSNK